MNITPENVKNIAVLGRIQLTNAEVQDATRDLSNVLGHFSTIQDIDTGNAPAAEDVSGLVNVMRTDEAAPGTLCSTETLLARAPQVRNGQIQVKAVFK